MTSGRRSGSEGWPDIDGNVAHDPTKPRRLVRGAQRLFIIIEHLSARAMTLTEVATSADLPKSTAFRFLRTLEDNGWVVRDKDGVYTLGAAVVGLAAQYLSGNPLVEVATPGMRALNAELDETISLSRRVGLTRVCVQEFASTKNLRLVLGLGERGPLHAGASGLLLFAHMPPHERQSLAGQGFEKFTSRTITDLEKLEAEAEKIRKKGWALTQGQKTVGGLAIAVPITVPGSSGEIAALGVFGPEARCSTKREQRRWLDALLETAKAIDATTVKYGGSKEEMVDGAL